MSLNVHGELTQSQISREQKDNVVLEKKWLLAYKSLQLIVLKTLLTPRCDFVWIYVHFYDRNSLVVCQNGGWQVSTGRIKLHT